MGPEGGRSCARLSIYYTVLRQLSFSSIIPILPFLSILQSQQKKPGDKMPPRRIYQPVAECMEQHVLSILGIMHPHGSPTSLIS